MTSDPRHTAAPASGRWPRARGLVVLGALIAGGLGVVGIYFFVQPRLVADTERRIRSAPSTTEGRLEIWREYGSPQVVQHLRWLRISSRQPFLASFVALPEREEDPPEVWGIDLSATGPEQIRREGTDLIVHLPAPAVVAREYLAGPNAELVPFVRHGEPLPDPLVRVQLLLEFKFADLISRLQRDIPGTRLLFEIGDDPPRPIAKESWP